MTVRLSDDGAWVHLYGSNVLDTTLTNGTKLKLTQQTEYPWDGHITLTIDEADNAEFTVMLRIPGWTSTAVVTVNGEVCMMPLMLTSIVWAQQMEVTVVASQPEYETQEKQI